MALMECAICFNVYTADGAHLPCVLQCGHTFGRSCLRRALIFRSECPTCRYEITGDVSRIPKNYGIIEILTKDVPKSETPLMDACTNGSIKFIRDTINGLASEKKELSNEIAEEHAANAARIASIPAMEASIANLKRLLQVEKAKLVSSKAAILSYTVEASEQSPDRCYLRHLRRIIKTACSQDYILESHGLCRDIMSKSFLAFYEAQTEFDPRELHARILEVESMSEYSAREEYRNYVVSLLKLEYHYLYSGAANKFDIWALLEMRMRVHNLKNEFRDRHATQVCEKLIDMHPDVSMRINFTDGQFLEVPLHSTIEWVTKQINRTFSVASSAGPLNLYCGRENLSAKGGKLFDMDIVARTIFSFSSPKCTTVVRTLTPNLFKLRVIEGQKLTIYEIKQLICDRTAAAHLQTISFNGVTLSDEGTLEGHNIVQRSLLHVAVGPRTLEDLIFSSATVSVGNLPPPTPSARAKKRKRG